MLTRHCIVTPQFPGLTRNGGIGTHCYYLAQQLEKLGAHTTLLYTQPYPEGVKVARLPFQLHLVRADELPEIPCLLSTWFLTTSARCYEWLKHQQFDFIHFQDWLGNGFRSVQAKRLGQAFAHTTLTCMINGPTLWTRQGMKVDPYSTRDDMLLDYVEAYTARHCDELLVPSRYTLEWARANWKIDHPRPHVLPYLFQAPFREETPPGEISHLIFFGRLETRKGLELFLEALRLLDRQGVAPRLVTFLGSRQPLRNVDSGLHIERWFQEHLPGWTHRILDQLDHAEALEFLRKSPGKLVVIPSLSETLCYTVLECIECNFNFIAARVGGIPELFEESDRLFEPTAAALAAKLTEALNGTPLAQKPCWSVRDTEEKWRAFLDQAGPQSARSHPARLPLVSVCIPHYNGSPLLEQTLVGLDQQTYPNFEVFVRDDASTDPGAQEDFARLAETFGRQGWSFTRNEVNRGPGYTRNRMSEMASGEYLLFVDADNVPGREMIERLVTGALTANLDATGCCMKTVLMDKPLHSHQAVHSTWMPVGPALPVIFFGNLVGETNSLFRAEVFRKIGGFAEDTNFGNEDWELLIRIVLAGYEFDIVPDQLFLYRIRAASNVRTTPSIQNRLRAWRPLFEHLPPEKQFLATSLFIWEWRIEENNNAPSQPIPRDLQNYQSSFLYRLHRFLRHPKKGFAEWLGKEKKS